MKVRSIRQTVKALTERGIKVPARQGRKITFERPKLNNARRLLINPAYTGVYVYGKTESQRGGPVLATGQSPRVKVPEHRWVRIPNHHPPYISVEQQAEIKLRLANNNFVRRNRLGRGSALTQGLLRCTLCGKLLSVNYHRNKSYSYGCGWESEPCTRFISYEFDGYILREVFRVLETPPLEMLRAALEESRNQERTRANWIQSERERLEHEEQKARECADLTRGELPRVHAMHFRDSKMCFRRKSSSSGKSRLKSRYRKLTNLKRNWKDSAGSPVICLAYGIIRLSVIRSEKKFFAA